MDDLGYSYAESSAYVGFFRQDAAVQTESSEILDLKEVLSLFHGLRDVTIRTLSLVDVAGRSSIASK